MPPEVAAFGHRDVVLRTLDDNDALDRRGGIDRNVGVVLEREHGTSAPGSVLRHEDLRRAVLDPVGERIGGEAAEAHRVDGADPRTGEHRDRKLRNHPHVDGDPIALLHAEGLQHIGELRDFLVKLCVRDVAGVAGFTDPVIGDLVADGVEVTVEAVVREIQLPVLEPLVERRVVGVEADRWLLVPRDALEGLLHPPRFRVSGFLVDVRPSVRCSNEFGGRWEDPVLGHQVLKSDVGHSYNLRIANGYTQAMRKSRSLGGPEDPAGGAGGPCSACSQGGWVDILPCSLPIQGRYAFGALPPSSSGLGLRPFKAATGIRIPLGARSGAW